MTPDEQAAFQDWLDSLPDMPPPVPVSDCSGDLNPCTNDDCTPTDECVWTDYVEFPRRQGGGTCWLFTTVGLMEVQYMIDCCVKGICTGLDTTGIAPADFCAANPQRELHGEIGPTLDLSEQLLSACSPYAYPAYGYTGDETGGGSYGMVEAF